MFNKNEQNGLAKKDTALINYSINGSHVRVIEDECKSRIMQLNAAVEYAKSKGMDLVQISYDKDNHVPVAKIQNYGKFKYEQQKREKTLKKAARAAAADVKEITFSIRIEDGDRATKINHIKKFLLEERAKVKISIRLLRREMNLIGMAKEQMMAILDNFTDIAELDSNPSFASGIMSCVVRPKKS